MLQLALAGAFLLAGFPALAQAPDTTVNARPIFDLVSPYLFTLISAAVVGLLTWLTALFQRYTGMKMEEKHRLALHSALMTGVGASLARIRERASETNIDVRNKVAADAIRYAQTSVPDALKALGADPVVLAKIALSKITQLAEAPSGTVDAARPTGSVP